MKMAQSLTAWASLQDHTRWASELSVWTMILVVNWEYHLQRHRHHYMEKRHHFQKARNEPVGIHAPCNHMAQASDEVGQETCEEILQASYVGIHQEGRRGIHQDAMELDEATLEVLHEEAGVKCHHDFQSPDFQHHPCQKGVHHRHHEEALTGSNYVVPDYLQMLITGFSASKVRDHGSAFLRLPDPTHGSNMIHRPGSLAPWPIELPSWRSTPWVPSCPIEPWESKVGSTGGFPDRVRKSLKKNDAEFAAGRWFPTKTRWVFK